MVRDHGYSIRKLADKLGKDKGYLENRLRLADAPDEIRQLVSLRKDTLSHAYELMKVDDPKKRRRLADQVAAGQLTLIKLREKIEGRRTRPRDLNTEAAFVPDGRGRRLTETGRPRRSGRRRSRRSSSPTTRWSTPATSWPRPSRTWSASSGRRIWSTRCRRPTGPTSRST